ncbi:hypothetical protein GGI25_000078 [Coemansia spiralis]|uniref:Mediator of RNA polymerase II transcription subunit 4 n=2 Tax=Coemansia TaxID=4863 RepID=A0A9W8GDD0_9FUNG|nr:hypothetical protein BX070DRAFT_249722 [Coemansia spiralis]KAJ1992577.1 hypothetical protein EDC05_002723 [Coemansia umbellata]KAJ2623043.1 hypothetical protein GGI26_002652 [Coemansia sp. RSA 1358]KAJ2681123.1 hypothetical protein GGI25_000078 [Coemansia spiralis]
MNNLDFDNVPLVNLLNDLLSEYETSLRSLLSQLDTEGNKNTADEASRKRLETSQQIVVLDQNLQKLYDEIVRHQKRQEEIRKTQLLSIESGKAKLRFINSMLDAKAELEEALVDVDKKISRAHVAQKANPSVLEIIEYARKLGKFTSAPPNFDPNNSNGMPPEPPHPLLMTMRAGILNRYRMKKTAKNNGDHDEDVDEEMFINHMEDDQFDDVDADDLLLSLDLNPDLE